MVDRAGAVGWARDRVGVMEEDHGHSGQSMGTRLGLQRVLAAVSLDHVGLSLGLERSRLARSHQAWPHWRALWAILRPLWADADGLSDPTDSKDRGLGGLRGRRSAMLLLFFCARRGLCTLSWFRA